MTEHSIKQLIAKHEFRRLVQLAHSAFVNLALVDLAVMLPFRNNQKTFLKPLGLEILRYHKGIADMRLHDVFLFPPIFRDVTIRATDFDIRKHLTKPLHQRLSHNPHECRIAGRASPASTSQQLDFSSVIRLVAIFAECDQIIRRVSASLPTFQMMYVEFHRFLRRFMRSATLAGIAIAVQDVLTNIVFVIHFAELVVRANRQRLAGLHSLQTLKIELCCLGTDYRDWEQSRHILDTLDVVPDLHFD